MNLATIDVTASSNVTQNGSSFTFGGTGATGGSLAATTRATGIAGGDGADAVHSEAAITVNAASSLASTGGSTTPFGTSQAGATIGADTTAVGIAGGAGDDTIENLDTIDVTADSTVTLSGTSFSLGGAGNASGALEASSRATGIAGGEGEDWIQNLGTVAVRAASRLDSRSGSNVGFGTSDSGGSSGAVTDAVGIDGGSDEDFLNNLGTIDVAADSVIAMNGSTYTFGGAGASAGTLAATTRAAGMSGGDGTDRLRNQGDVTVRATSSLDSKGESKATFGTSSGGATSGAVTEATGIDGGAGDNVIENLLGKIDASAVTTVSSNKAAFTFGGTASTGAVLDGVARARGVAAGDGANSIRNDAAVIAAATANVSATGGTKTTFGGTSGSGTATADASASGIGTGAGADVMLNLGTITVNATSDGTTSNSADAGWIAGTADTVSSARGTASGYGVSAGGGDNALQNDGDINVTAKGTGYAFAFADGAKLSWSGDGQAKADSLAGASATGIMAGNGRNQIINNQAITVLALATTVKSLTTTSQVCTEGTQVKQECTTTTDPDTGESTTVCQDVLDGNGDTVLEVVSNCENQEIVLDTKPTYAAANGNGLNGHGNATSTASGTAEAYGIKAGDGDNLIVNNGDMSVTARPEAKAIVSVSGGTTGNATGSASASASATAYGIWAGNGNNEIANSGVLTVTAAPMAQASADIAAGKGVCIPFLFWTWCIADGTGTGTATASFDALAVGMHAGNGDNRVTNNGILTVRASPETDGATASVTDGIDNPTLSTSVASRAVGIETGDGNNQIVNTADGVIDVGATAVPGSNCSPPCTTSTRAIGIQTGNGNNLIVNDGTIATSVPSGSGSRADIAIRTGGGNDGVELGDGSSTLGSIELYAGDDSLAFVAGARVAGLNDAPGSVDGGTGTDSLDFNGAGGYTGSIQNFESATKRGNGTFALSSLPTMQQLKAIRGTLQTNGAYSFAPGGSYEAWVYGGNDHGMLQVHDGSASIAGSLTVSKGKGLYRDGATYDIIQASNGLSGDFDATTLPYPTPLLNFSLNGTADALQVLAHAASFTTVATNRVGMAVARYLDAIGPAATGDLANVMGEIQNLSEQESLDAALTSLSPEVYDGATRVAYASVTFQTRQLLTRLDAMRAGDQASSASASGFAPVRLAYSGDSQGLASLFDGERKQSGKRGLWLEAFGQWGDQETDSDGYTGFDVRTAGLSLGYDRAFSENWVAGAALGYSRVNADFNESRASSVISGQYLMLYGGWNKNGAYAQGVLSYGRNDYDQQRWVDVGAIDRLAVSSHSGNVLAASLSGGFMSQAGVWSRGPFAALHYARIDEESFRETGAGGVDLLVESKDTSALSAELGLRALHSMKWRNGDLVTELSASWSHDFGIDDRAIIAGYAGAPGTAFALQGQDSKRNGAIFGAGLGYIAPNGLSAALRYQGEIRDGYKTHAIFGQVRINF